jgi:hypothetical protein
MSAHHHPTAHQRAPSEPAGRRRVAIDEPRGRRRPRSRPHVWTSPNGRRRGRPPSAGRRDGERHARAARPIVARALLDGGRSSTHRLNRTRPLWRNESTAVAIGRRQHPTTAFGHEKSNAGQPSIGRRATRARHELPDSVPAASSREAGRGRWRSNPRARPVRHRGERVLEPQELGARGVAGRLEPVVRRPAGLARRRPRWASSCSPSRPGSGAQGTRLEHRLGARPRKGAASVYAPAPPS